ncbi:MULTISPECIES: hypothetical protein [Ensifer]|uniref:hypothetical protein n=1 Tax=Ensifer TaxID=106591 RepID=UPI00132F3FEC|nr:MULTISPECIES: hypothetical protein [Ensifer]MBD9538763.1 hypothetical protein [Ensifer sp. ENS04]QHG71369.1 hypothetical protein DQW09_16610 [Ensifer adhaerens]
MTIELRESQVMAMVRGRNRLSLDVRTGAVMVDSDNGRRPWTDDDDMALLEVIQKARPGVLNGHAFNLDRLRRCVHAVAAEHPIGDLADDGRR